MNSQPSTTTETTESGSNTMASSSPSKPRSLATATAAAASPDDTMMESPLPPPIKPTIRRYSKQLSMTFMQTVSRTVGKTCHLRSDPESLQQNPQQELFHLKIPTSPGLCESLPDDLICKALSFLDVQSLLRVRRCNRYFCNLASRNESGWEGLCRALWSDKVHVMPGLLCLPEPIPPSYYMNAYQTSIQDAIQRQHITLDELCYDPETHTGTVWSFRFKASAGADWTNSDPWYRGLPCRKMVFLKDGSVRQYIAASSSSFDSQCNTASSRRSSASSIAASAAIAGSDSETSVPELIRPSFGSLMDPASLNEQRQQLDNDEPGNGNPQHREAQQLNNNGRLIHPPVTMSWRFSIRPMDLPIRPSGSYVRFSVGGREVPTYSVRRSPTGNWGFVMESCWGLYASFELPPKQSIRQERQRALAQQRQQEQRQQQRQRPQQQRRRLRRTEAGAMWVDVLDNGEETLSLNQGPHGYYNSHHYLSQQQHEPHDNAALMDDASLSITNEVQWREAFLYNVGARTLPEGEDATNEFDQAFRGLPIGDE